MEIPIKKTILITGITGFTGKHLETFYLSKRFEVYGTTFSKPKKSTHFFCNITQKKDVENLLEKIKPDYIIHTAAISYVAESDQESMYKVNVFGTINLLDTIVSLKINPKKIIIVSSAAAYGSIGETLSEKMCPKPLNHYGNSKLVMENMVSNYYNKLNIVITRPFNYTGLGQKEKFLIPKIVKHFKEKAKIIQLGNIDVYREFNDVNYLINCYDLLLNSKFQSDIVNVCSGKIYSIREVLALMEDISSHKIEIKVNPQFVRKNEIKILKGSTTLLFNSLKTQPKEFNLKDVLTKMFYN